MKPAKKKPAQVRSYLKTRRLAQGITQVDLAFYSGQSVTTVARIEHGNISVSVETLWRVAAVLGLSCKDIFPTLSARPRKAVRVLKRGAKAGGRHDRRAAEAFHAR